MLINDTPLYSETCKTDSGSNPSFVDIESLEMYSDTEFRIKTEPMMEPAYGVEQRSPVSQVPDSNDQIQTSGNQSFVDLESCQFYDDVDFNIKLEPGTYKDSTNEESLDNLLVNHIDSEIQTLCSLLNISAGMSILS